MPGTQLIFSVFGQGDHSLFDYACDPRIAVRRFDEADPEIPGVLVLTRPEKPDKVDYWSGVPERIWSSVSAGATRLVLDASCEGWPHAEAFTEEIGGFFRRRAIRPDEVAYVTQDRMFEADYRASCRRRGEAPMHVLVYDYFVQRLALDLPPDHEALYQQRLSGFESAGEARPRIFLSLNYTPREAKVLFLLQLIERGLWDDGLISFGGFESRADGSDLLPRLYKRMRLMPGFDDLARRLARHFPELQAKGRVTFGFGEDPRMHTKESYRADPLAEYAMTWFSVVTESDMGGRLNRLTEKSLKPLMNFHPMLVLGSPGTLGLVREYGFETFGELFDEAYDEEAEPRRRFEAVFAQLERFCRQDRERLPRLVASRGEAQVQRLEGAGRAAAAVPQQAAAGAGQRAARPAEAPGRGRR